MNNNKLERVFNSLTPKEFRGFKRHLESKTYNQNPKVLSLFNHLRLQTTRDHPNFSKELIHKNLFKGKPYNEKHIRDIQSYLFKAGEKFLSLYEHQTDLRKELLDLCKAYRKKGLQKLFNATTKKVRLLIDAGKKDSEYHEFNYRLLLEQYNAIFKKSRAKANNLQQVSDSLDISYMASRLKQCCLMLSHQSVYNISYDMGLVKAVVKEVERKQLLHIPAISIYYYGYLAQTNTDNIQYFTALQESLKTSVELFNIDEMQDIYVLAINIGIKNLNQGRLDFIPVLLEIYKSGVDKKILLTNNRISPFTFKNIIALALREKQFDWVQKFIEAFRYSIDSEESEAIYSYNLAKLQYEKKDFSEALNLLLQTSTSADLYVNLDTKILLSRIYYEQDDLDALENMVESFRIYIRRSKIISYHKTSYSNFLNSMLKLMSKNQFDKSAVSMLRKEIEELQPLPDKYWFLEQLGG